jgi:hypothetical protein
MKAIKRALDPENRMNPGKMIEVSDAGIDESVNL